MNEYLKEYFQQHGMIHESFCSLTPQENGEAERKNRHILKTARALLIESHVSQRFWDNSVTTAIHLLNWMPSKVLNFQTSL